MSDKKFKKSDYILDSEVDAVKYYFGDKFAMDSGADNVWDSYALDRDTCIRSIDFYGLGDKEIRCPQGAREWGYNFFMTNKRMAGDGARTGGNGYKVTPKDRREALSMLKDEIFELYGLHGMTDWETCPGHYLWQHYSCEWGCTSICAEVGESISSPQTHAAFCRGAARQYALPWSLQFSFWQWGKINDYSGAEIWGFGSEENGGHSPELYKRIFLLAYMGGASHFYPEAGLVINFRKELTEDNVYKLSPIGEMTRKLNDFIARNPDIGTSYAPFGIVLDRYHGMFPGSRRINPKKVFGVFDYNDGDDLTYNLFDLIFPCSWNLNTWNEFTYMVNGPIGETCDVLLQTASEKVLKSYPCLILSGDIKLTEEETSQYIRYVQNGGTLILNTVFLDYFPDYKEKYDGRIRCDIEDGRGKVIVYGPWNSVHYLRGILKEQLARFVPFEMSQEIDFSVNVKDNGLIITLMNNDGYYYHCTNGEDIDESATKTFTLKYTGGAEVKGLRELWNGQELTPADAVEVTLAPAETKIFEFIF